MATINGSSSADNLTGTTGDDVINGLEGVDSIDAMAGNDTLIGGKGNDVLMGGEGNDQANYTGTVDDYAFAYSTSTGKLTITDRRIAQDGVDTVSEVESFSFAGVIKTFAQVQALVSGGPSSGDDNLVGTDNNDTIDALSGNDTVEGRAGDDILIGGPGNDRLSGGFGSDSLSGGDGNDTLIGGLGNDTLDGGAGIDTAVFTRSRGTIGVGTTPGSFTMSDVLDSFSPGSGEGRDTLLGIERIRFGGGGGEGVAFDMARGQSGANTVLVVGVLLGKELLSNKALMTAALAFFDLRPTLQDACDVLVSAGVVASVVGSNDNRAFVSVLFQNLTGTQPTALIDQVTASVGSGPGQQTQAQLLAAAASLDLTQDLVNLVGLAQTGLTFA